MSRSHFKNTLIAILLLGFFTMMVPANIEAQEPQVQEALKDTKESVDELVEAKDEENPFDLAFRIKTFKKVLNLSSKETKDLKIQLLSLDLKDKETVKWREQAVTNLNQALDHYAQVKQEVENKEDDMTLEEIQNIAKEFKRWRQNNYLPLHHRVQNFIFIQKEKQMLNMAQNRGSKIEKDVTLLENAGFNVAPLKERLQKSKEKIETATDQNSEAMNQFTNAYISPSESTSTIVEATSTATSTTASTTAEAGIETADIAGNQAVSTSSATSSLNVTEKATSSLKKSTATTTENPQTATSTEVDSKKRLDSLDSSIRDRVRTSLENVREAYRIFIEMSSFVRKLLN